MADSEKSVAVGYADRVAELKRLALKSRATARKTVRDDSDENQELDRQAWVEFCTLAATLECDLEELEAELS
jgi:hypothetical protein